MFIRYYCTQCGQKYKSGLEHAGKQVNCAKCGALLQIPNPELIPAAPVLPTEPVMPPPVSSTTPEPVPTNPPIEEAPKPKLKLQMKKVAPVQTPAPAPIPEPPPQAPVLVPIAEEPPLSSPETNAADELAKYGQIIRSTEPPPVAPKLVMPNAAPIPLAPVSTTASGTFSTPLPPNIPVAVPIDDQPSTHIANLVTTKNSLPASHFLLGILASFAGTVVGLGIWCGLALALAKPLSFAVLLPAVLAGLGFALVAKENSVRGKLATVLIVVAGIAIAKLSLGCGLPNSAWQSSSAAIDPIFYSNLIYDDWLEKGEIKDPFAGTATTDEDHDFSEKLGKTDKYQEIMKKIAEKVKKLSPAEEQQLAQRSEKLRLLPALIEEMRKKGEIDNPYAKVEAISCPPGDRPPMEYLSALRQADIAAIKQQQLARLKLKQLSAADEKRLFQIAGEKSTTGKPDPPWLRAYSWWDALWISLALVATLLTCGLRRTEQ